MTLNNTRELTIGLIQLLDNVKSEHGYAAIVQIRVDDYGVTVRDVTTNKIIWDADTLAEFTYKFLPQVES